MRRNWGKKEGEKKVLTERGKKDQDSKPCPLGAGILLSWGWGRGKKEKKEPSRFSQYRIYLVGFGVKRKRGKEGRSDPNRTTGLEASEYQLWFLQNERCSLSKKEGMKDTRCLEGSFIIFHKTWGASNGKK